MRALVVLVFAALIVGALYALSWEQERESDRDRFIRECRAEGHFLEYKGRVRMWCIDADRRILREFG